MDNPYIVSSQLKSIILRNVEVIRWKVIMVKRVALESIRGYIHNNLKICGITVKAKG